MVPLLARNSTMMLYGRPGLGKTTLAMQLGLAVASGSADWLGFPIRRPGPVVWLQLDMPRPELAMMLTRALARCPAARAQTHFLRLFDHTGEEMWTIDVLRDNISALKSVVRAIEPALFLIDTVADVYKLAPHDDLNQQVREVVRKLREIAPSAGIVYLQHQRKRPAGAPGDDPDSYLGGMAWAAMASSVLQLNRHTKRVTDEEDGEETFEISYDLAIRKMRLAEVPCEHLKLTKEADGFFGALWKAPAALHMAPHLVPASTPQKDVLAALARHFAIAPETLRKALQRERG